MTKFRFSWILEGLPDMQEFAGKRTIRRVSIGSDIRYEVQMWAGPEQVAGGMWPREEALAALRDEWGIREPDVLIFVADQASGLPVEF